MHTYTHSYIARHLDTPLFSIFACVWYECTSLSTRVVICMFSCYGQSDSPSRCRLLPGYDF